MKPKTILAVLSFALCVVFVSTAGAQEVLPRPEQPFGGKIGRTTKESVKDFPKMVEAPKGAPNILLILTDDVGFGASSTFGGPIPTVTMDRLANAGLRYNNFHTTALCSPTRAALLSGRNHHSASTATSARLRTASINAIFVLMFSSLLRCCSPRKSVACFSSWKQRQRDSFILWSRLTPLPMGITYNHFTCLYRHPPL